MDGANGRIHASPRKNTFAGRNSFLYGRETFL